MFPGFIDTQRKWNYIIQTRIVWQLKYWLRQPKFNFNKNWCLWMNHLYFGRILAKTHSKSLFLSRYLRHEYCLAMIDTCQNRERNENKCMFFKYLLLLIKGKLHFFLIQGVYLNPATSKLQLFAGLLWSKKLRHSWIQLDSSWAFSLLLMDNNGHRSAVRALWKACLTQLTLKSAQGLRNHAIKICL